MKMKKLLSSVICTTMLLSSFTFVHANETLTATETWNYALVSDDTKDLYADFPMIINKSVGKDMSLSMQFQYLKNISSSDAVKVTITDLSNSEVVENYQLTEDNKFIIWDDVENNKSFSICIEENIGGIEEIYTGYINTKFVQADFPANVILGNNHFDYNKGEEFYAVAIKKIGEHASCAHDENMECTDACKTASKLDLLTPDDLNTFYSSLDANCYYEMQVDASKSGSFNHYQGFISTYPDGAEMGIFTRGYSFSLNPVSTISMTSEETYGVATASSTVSSSGYDFSSATEYLYYKNLTASSLDTDSNIIVKWVVPETGNYTIETIGNLDTKLYQFSTNRNTGEIYDKGYAYYSGGAGNNAAIEIGILVGEVEYFVINLERGETGPFGFRIRRNDYGNSDGISAFRDEVQENYDIGIFSPITNNCQIEFDGDINIFAYDVSKGNGYLCFENVDTALKVDIYTVYGRTGGFDTLWKEETINVNAVDPRATYMFAFAEGIHYIDISQSIVPTSSSDEYFDGNSYGYDFDFYDPRLKDSVDLAAHATYGDSPVYPTMVTLPYHNETRTIHRGDADWFTFTTGMDGGDLTAKIDLATNGNLYNIALYEEVEIRAVDPPSWTSPTNIGVIEAGTTYNELTYSDLLPNHTYFIKVSTSGDVYSSAHPYTIDIDVAISNPTAVLNGDVSLSHTAGVDITDLTAMKNTIMDQMTCTLYGETVEDDTAVSDVELYYNDTILTASAVNLLAAGQYTIIPKYKGVAATGGTVTLTVTEQVTEMVEVTVPTSIEYINEYDWLHCAKTMADFRLTREGSSASTISEDDVADMLGINPDAPSRGTLYQTYRAAYLFYSNGQSSSGSGFTRVTNANAVTEEALFDMINDGSIVIMQLADSTATSDTTKMRYLVISGVNKTTHQLKVYDCLQLSNNLLRWVDTSDIFDGGYISSNANIKFLGSIIEVSSN